MPIYIQIGEIFYEIRAGQAIFEISPLFWRKFPHGSLTHKKHN